MQDNFKKPNLLFYNWIALGEGLPLLLAFVSLSINVFLPTRLSALSFLSVFVAYRCLQHAFLNEYKYE